MNAVRQGGQKWPLFLVDGRERPDEKESNKSYHRTSLCSHDLFKHGRYECFDLWYFSQQCGHSNHAHISTPLKVKDNIERWIKGGLSEKK